MPPSLGLKSLGLEPGFFFIFLESGAEWVPVYVQIFVFSGVVVVGDVISVGAYGF